MLIGRSLLVGSVVLLWIASIAPFSDALCELIERHYPPIEVANATVADAILVLGGGIASRSRYASRLFRAGKAPVVVAVSGGESAAMAEFLVDLGVARESILQESRSRTTVENALYVKPILEVHGISHALLVTSALHMPRAVAIFRAAGIDVVPASSDVEVVAGRKYGWSTFLPNADALFRTTRVIHEVFGFLGFRVQIWLAERAV